MFWLFSEIRLFVPLHGVVYGGIMNFIILFVTKVIVLARFPQTWIYWLDDDAKDKGNPLPVMVAYTPAPGLVYNGLKLVTEIGNV